MDYTKGEWTVDTDYDWVRDSSGRVVANCTGHPDSKANALLIAAAPEMYEALQAALVIVTDIQSRHTKQSFHNNRVYSDAAEAIGFIQQALAKAEGKEG